MADESKDPGAGVPMYDEGGYGGDGGGGGGGGGYDDGGDGGEYYDDGMGYDDEDGEGEDPDAYDPEGDLPMFANKANKELDTEIRGKEARLSEVVKHTAEHEERVKIMEEHLKNVQQELAHTQQLVDAKNKEISTEDHLKQLAEREAGRVRAELTKCEVRAEELQDEMNVVQNHLFKGTERLDRFKLQMNWNQEELEQWALAAKQKEEDNLALQKYTRADEAKIKELSLNIEKVTQAVARRRATLDEEVTETQAKQIELDKTAEEFRTLHAERQQLVRQWQEAIQAMRRRDEEIAEAGERFAQAKEDIAEKQEILADHVARLKSQQDDNVAMESKIGMRERVVAKQREQYQTATLKLTEFKDEVEVLKNELQKAASDLLQKRSENVTLNAELEASAAKLDTARKRFQSVKKTLETAMRGTDDVEAVAQQREEELKEREGDLVSATKELTVLKESMFRQSTELFKLRQEESNLIAEISGAQAASKNLSAKIHKLDQESLQQQELVYNAEFQIQQLERKVARAGGERSDAERKVLNARIEALQATLDKENATAGMLREQVKRVGDDHRAMQRRHRELNRDVAAFNEKMDELLLQNESAEQTLREQVKEKEEVMVQHDVLKLEVKKLREALSARADDVYGLSNRKFQLEMSMEERKKEITVHRDVQRAQLKVSEEERHKVKMELQERKQKVDKLRAKFETLAKKTATPDDSDDDGEEHSQAYYVIKAAQKREELQREGDELDGLIRKAEREIRALENTLKHLNVRNTEFRSSFHKADMGSREAQQARNLEEQVKSAKDALFRKKKELQRMQTDLEEDRRRVAQLDEQVAQMEAHIDHLRSARGQVESEEAEQRDQIERAARKVEGLSRAHREAAGVDPRDETLDERAFMAQAVRDTNNNVLFTLNQLAREFPELQGSLAVSVQKYGLVMPSRPPSRAATADVRAAAPSAGGPGVGGMGGGAAAGAGDDRPPSARSRGSQGSGRMREFEMPL